MPCRKRDRKVWDVGALMRNPRDCSTRDSIFSRSPARKQLSAMLVKSCTDGWRSSSCFEATNMQATLISWRLLLGTACTPHHESEKLLVVSIKSSKRHIHNVDFDDTKKSVMVLSLFEENVVCEQHCCMNGDKCLTGLYWLQSGLGTTSNLTLTPEPSSIMQQLPIA